MKCTICNEEYEAKRASSKYCSSNCRVKALRDKVSVTDNDLSVTQNPLSVTVSVTKDALSVTKPVSVTSGDLSFHGHLLSQIPDDQVFKIGTMYHKPNELPYWLLDGAMDRDSLPMSIKSNMDAGTKRETFKELMLQSDIQSVQLNLKHAYHLRFDSDPLPPLAVLLHPCNES